MNTDTKHIKRMLECTLGNEDFFTDLREMCQKLIESRGGKAQVTLKQAEQIDMEVSLVVDEVVNE